MTLDLKITFKKLETSDLATIFKWINEPHVEQGYHQCGPYTFQDVVNDFHPLHLETLKVQGHIIHYDNVPIGYIQNYKLEYDDYEEDQDIPWGSTAGYDIFIGDPEYVNRGLGTKILCKFLIENIFSNLETNFVIINPKANNDRAIKVYKKIGFEVLKIVEEPDTLPVCVMRLERNVFNQAFRQLYF